MKIKNIKYYLAISVSLITFAVYLPALQNDFVGWDDGAYVTDNSHIRLLFSPAFFKWAFSDFYASNWHPLTWISHALDYAIWGLNPLGHHLTNNILHALNTFLVVLLVVRLVEALQGARGKGQGATTPARQTGAGDSRFTIHDSRFALIAAGVTGLLFGLHPIHVESVAWVAERKDLLCALFYLLSVMAYMRYATNTLQRAKAIGRGGKMPVAEGAVSSIRHELGPMLSALCFFALALMSKPMAVSLPFVLLILDWYPLQRIISLRTFKTAFIEKIPFIALCIASSILTILAQKAGGAMLLTEYVPLWARVLVAAKALIAYIWKMVIPLNLLPFYQYPHRLDMWSMEYIMPAILVAGITVICILVARKHKLWPAVWGYYVLTLSPVLGFIQVGGQSMADRYTYLPSLGPFFLAGLFVAWVYDKVTALQKGSLRIKLAFTTAGAAIIISLAYLTFVQTGIWSNAVGLWSYVIQKEPEKVPFVYYNRGVAFFRAGQMDRAIEDYSRAIALDPSYSKAYVNRGFVFEKISRSDKAIADYDKAVMLNPLDAQTFNNRGAIFEKAGELDKAIADYDKVIELTPGEAQSYNNRGVVFERMGLYDKAIADYDRAIALNPSNADVYFNRGNAYDEIGRPYKAIADYGKAITLNPDDSQAYNNRGVIFEKIGEYDKAIADFDKAVALNPSNAEAYNNRLDALGKKYGSPAKQRQTAEPAEDALH
jgi:tetratricopeptide (TPR) repeat protein